MCIYCHTNANTYVISNELGDMTLSSVEMCIHLIQYNKHTMPCMKICYLICAWEQNKTCSEQVQTFQRGERKEGSLSLSH